MPGFVENLCLILVDLGKMRFNVLFSDVTEITVIFYSPMGEENKNIKDKVLSIIGCINSNMKNRILSITGCIKQKTKKRMYKF